MLPRINEEVISLEDRVGDLYANRACLRVNSDIFFPTTIDSKSNMVPAKEVRETIELAISICKTCPIKQECFDYGLAIGEKNGIWGGVYLNDYYRRNRRIS